MFTEESGKIKNRVSYYSNSLATFNIAVETIDRSGDVHPHPGPGTNINNDDGEPKAKERTPVRISNRVAKATIVLY